METSRLQAVQVRTIGQQVVRAFRLRAVREMAMKAVWAMLMQVLLGSEQRI